MDTAEIGRTATDLLEALDRGDWRRAAGYVDPVLSERLHGETAQRIAYWQRPEVPTAETYKGEDPEMPDAVAEYLEKRGRDALRDARSFANNFPGLDRPEELQDMSAEEYAARYLEACDPRSWPRPEPPVDDGADSEGEETGPAEPKRTFLGVVAESDSLAHVVYRIEWGSPPRTFDQVDLLSLRKTENGWRVLSLDLNGLPRNMWFVMDVATFNLKRDRF